MKLAIPSKQFKFVQLSNLTKLPPGKFIICWGRIKEISDETKKLTIEDGLSNTIIEINQESTVKEEDLSKLKDKIVKIFGEITINGLLIHKIMEWGVDWSLLIKFNKSIAESHL